MAKKKGGDPVESAITDGTYNELHTPLNCPKAEKDPQAPLENSAIPGSKSEGIHDPMGYLKGVE